MNGVPQYTITAQVRDSNTNALIADFTGVNALQWPQAAFGLTQTQLDHYIKLQANWLVLTLAGLEPPP